MRNSAQRLEAPTANLSTLWKKRTPVPLVTLHIRRWFFFFVVSHSLFPYLSHLYFFQKSYYPPFRRRSITVFLKRRIILSQNAAPSLNALPLEPWHYSSYNPFTLSRFLACRIKLVFPLSVFLYHSSHAFFSLLDLKIYRDLPTPSHRSTHPHPQDPTALELGCAAHNTIR